MSLNLEVRFLYSREFPVFLAHERHIPIAKILDDGHIFLGGNYRSLLQVTQTSATLPAQNEVERIVSSTSALGANYGV